MLCLFLMLSTTQIKAQNDPVYDELSVFFQVQNIGTKEISAVVRDQEVLLPIADIFEFLKIKATMSQAMDSVSGFFISPESTYLIDKTHLKIVYLGKTYQMKSTDFIRTETNLYLLSKHFGDIFGLNCTFNMRTLAVTMFTKIELPALRDMRLEQMHDNVSHLKGENKTDTTIRQSRSLFHFGMADYSIISSQQIGAGSDTRINLALGTVIAGGEANFLLNYNNNEVFTEKQQFYNLKYVNNDNSFLRQTTLGKIAPNAISSIYNPVVGVTLTNTPTTFRRSFGTYPLSDYTTPGWMVELYVNNVLVDYKKADASGFFSFQVPLVYGTSNVKLKFYGPWGEERAKEQLINVPFNFMPVKEFEYTLTGGMVEDGAHAIFSRGVMNYGVTRAITIGAGVEYLSSVVTGTTMPFVTLATRPISNLILSGEYTYGVRSKGVITYQMPKSIQLELNYTKYKIGQKAVNFSFSEERKLIFAAPLRGDNYSLYNRVTYTQTLLPGLQYSNAEWLISGSFHGVNTNLTNYAMFVEKNRPYVFSNLSMSFKLPHGYTMIPQLQYEYGNHELISAKVGVEKYVLKNGFFTASYENNFASKLQTSQFGFRYDLPYAQTGFTARKTNENYTLMELGRGSLIVDGRNHYVNANSRVNVGKGGIVFAPFLDLNCNNKRDPGEPMVVGLNVRMNGGIATENKRDSTIRIEDLEPFIKYYIQLDPNSFDNVSWKIMKKTLNVIVDPNQFKRIEIPIAVVGEVSGTINRQRGRNTDGLGRIIVNIFDLKGKLAGRTLSEQDGYYSFLGLSPGDYSMAVDSSQLQRLHLVATPAKITFSIKKIREGDVVESKDFLLKSTLPAAGGKTAENDDEPISPASKKAAESISTTVKPQSTFTDDNTGVLKTEADKTNQHKANENIYPPASTDGTKETGKAVQLSGEKRITPPPNNNQQESDASLNQQAVGASLNQKVSGTPPVPKASGTSPNQQLPGKSLNQKASGTSVHPQAFDANNQLFLQVGAYKNKLNAGKTAETLSATTHFPTVVVKENGWYKVRFGGFASPKEAEACKAAIVSNGILAANQIQEINSAQTKGIPVEVETSQPVAQRPNVVRKSVEMSAKNNLTTPDRTNTAPSQETLVKIDNSLKRHYFIQIGSFNNPRYATTLIKDITQLISYTVGIVYRDQKYKVRYGPFETQEELNDCIAKVEGAGISKRSQMKIDFEEIGSTPLADQPHLLDGYHVQIGAFKDKNNAKRFFQEMSAKYPYPILIIEEEGYYKVRFGPFKTLAMTKKCSNEMGSANVSSFMRSNKVRYF